MALYVHVRSVLVAVRDEDRYAGLRAGSHSVASILKATGQH